MEMSVKGPLALLAYALASGHQKRVQRQRDAGVAGLMNSLSGAIYGQKRKATNVNASPSQGYGGDYFKRLAEIESGGNPNAVNKASGAAGMFQFIPSTAKAYGLTNPKDPQQSMMAVQKLTSDNAAHLRKALGREPTQGELYLAHQQGAGGAVKLLTNPNAPAASLVGARALTLNGGNPNMTAGEFANLWRSKFEGVQAPQPAAESNVDLAKFLTGNAALPGAANFNPNFSGALGQFLAAAPGGGISVFSGYRSPEKQAVLYENKVKEYMGKGMSRSSAEQAARKWVAPPGKSRHNHGIAADLRFATPEARKWAHENAAKYGLNFRMGHEPWHIELASNGSAPVVSDSQQITPVAAPSQDVAMQQSPLVQAVMAPRRRQKYLQDFVDPYSEKGGSGGMALQEALMRKAAFEKAGGMPQQPIWSAFGGGGGQSAPQMAPDAGTAQVDAAGPSGGSQALFQAISSPYFKFLEPQQQKFVMDEFERQRALENPAPQEPIKMGDVLLDPKTYKPLYQPPEKPVDPLDQRKKELELKKLETEITQSLSPDARKKLGLNPIYGKRGENLVIMQPSESGGLVEAQLPEGVTLQPGIEKIDLGTAWGLMDRSGSITQVIPKDIKGEEAAKAAGKAQGEAQGQAPAAKITAEQTISKIDELLADPNLGSISGYEAWLPDPMAAALSGGKALDLRRRVEQLRGSAFLEAYNGLKGGGQITEVEGKKAEDALARLDTAQTDEGYRQALKDFRDAVAIGYQKLASKAGGKAPALDVPSPSARDSIPTTAADPDNPKPGEIVDGFRFKGGDPAKEENWELVQ